MNTENLATLKIHKLTQAQYDRELAAGNIDGSALYLTPNPTTLSGYGITDAYTKTEVDTIVSNYATQEWVEQKLVEPSLTITFSPSMPDIDTITWANGASKVEVDEDTLTCKIYGINTIVTAEEGSFDTGLVTSVVIGDSITSIGDQAFRFCSNLTSIEIPNSVTSIGEYAFYNSGLAFIKMSNSVTQVSDNAFAYCTALKSIKIPESITTIKNSMFTECYSLLSVEIPRTVTSIGDYAFIYCSSLTSVVIPDSVTSIGAGAFEYCSSLTSVVIKGTNVAGGTSIFTECGNLNNIIVPAEALDSYKTQENWSTYADKITAIATQEWVEELINGALGGDY